MSAIQIRTVWGKGLTTVVQKPTHPEVIGFIRPFSDNDSLVQIGNCNSLNCLCVLPICTDSAASASCLQDDNIKSDVSETPWLNFFPYCNNRGTAVG